MKIDKTSPLLFVVVVTLIAGGAAAALVYWTSPAFTHEITVTVPATISTICSFDPAAIPHDPDLQWFKDNVKTVFSPHPDDVQLNIMFYGATNIVELYVDVSMTGTYITDGSPPILKISRVFRDGDDNEIITPVATVTLTGGGMTPVEVPGFSELWDHDFDGVGGTHQHYLKLSFSFDEASLEAGLSPGEFMWDSDVVVTLGDSGI